MYYLKWCTSPINAAPDLGHALMCKSNRYVPIWTAPSKQQFNAY